MAGFHFPTRFILAAACTALLPLADASAASAPAFSAGTYSGIIQGDSLAGSGTVRVTINRVGRGSLVVKLGKTTERIAVVGSAEGEIVAKSAHSALAVELTPATGTLTGTLGTGSGAISVTLTDVTRAAAASVTASAGLAGSYTLILKGAPPAPASTDLLPLAGLAGVGTVQISAKGAVTFHGALTDGTQFTQTGTLDSSGGWALYATAANGEVLSGEVTFANTAASDFAGTIQWQAPAVSAADAETNTALQIAGSRYDATQSWDLPSHLLLDVSGDDGATTSFTTDPNRLGDLVIAAGTHSAALAIDRATGLILGGYGAAAGGLHVMAGVVFQKLNLAVGLEASVSGIPLTSNLVPNALSLIPTAPLKAGAIQAHLASVLNSLAINPSGVFVLEAFGTYATITSIDDGNGIQNFNEDGGATLTLGSSGATLTVGGIITNGAGTDTWAVTSGAISGATLTMFPSVGSPGNVVSYGGTLNLGGTGATILSLSGTGGVATGTGTLTLSGGGTSTIGTGGLTILNPTGGFPLRTVLNLGSPGGVSLNGVSNATLVFVENGSTIDGNYSLINYSPAASNGTLTLTNVTANSVATGGGVAFSSSPAYVYLTGPGAPIVFNQNTSGQNALPGSGSFINIPDEGAGGAISFTINPINQPITIITITPIITTLPAGAPTFGGGTLTVIGGQVVESNGSEDLSGSSQPVLLSNPFIPIATGHL